MEDYKRSIIKDLDYFTFKKDRLGVFRDAIEFDALNVAIHTTADKQQERIDRMKEILSAYGDETDKKKFQSVCGNITEMLMGTEVPPRKAFIYEHARDAELDV